LTIYGAGKVNQTAHLVLGGAECDVLDPNFLIWVNSVLNIVLILSLLVFVLQIATMTASVFRFVLFPVMIALGLVLLWYAGVHLIYRPQIAACDVFVFSPFRSIGTNLLAFVCLIATSLAVFRFSVDRPT